MSENDTRILARSLRALHRKNIRQQFIENLPVIITLLIFTVILFNIGR